MHNGTIGNRFSINIKHIYTYLLQIAKVSVNLLKREMWYNNNNNNAYTNINIV